MQRAKKTSTALAITAEKIKKLIAKHPTAHLYYHDNGAWILYMRKPTPKEMFDDEALKKLELIDGTDYEDAVGYMPRLTEALALICGITAESV
jgi:hypothetical protein